MTPVLLQSVEPCGCKSHTHTEALRGFLFILWVNLQHVLMIFFFATAAEAQPGPVCALQCKYLTSSDYQKMLWTSFADLLGENRPLSQDVWMTTPIFIYAKSKKKPLSSFHFPGPLLLAWLLDHFGRKKTLALFLLMFSLCLLPMFASLGRYVCALCFSGILYPN